MLTVENSEKRTDSFSSRINLLIPTGCPSLFGCSNNIVVPVNMACFVLYLQDQLFYQQMAVKFSGGKPLGSPSEDLQGLGVD